MPNSPLFSSFRTLFFYVGYWSSKPTKTYKIYGFSVSMMALYFTGIFIFLTKNSKNLPDLGFNFGATLTLIVTVLKILFSRTSKFQTIISEMLRNDEYITSNTLDVIRKNYLQHTSIPFRIINSYRMTMAGTLSLNLLISLFIYMRNRNAEPSFVKPFTYTYWVPFDEQEYYLLAHLYLNLVALSVGVIVVSSDFLVLAPILYLNCRLKSLKFVLRHPRLCFDEDYPPTENYYKLMRTCVLEHQAIDSELKKFNSITMYLILCDFLFHSTQIAGFAVSVLASETLSSVSNIFTLACGTFVVFQLFIVYWHGQILIDESGNISSAIYQSDWYEADKKTKKLLILMMMRSHKQLSLTVGPFFVNMVLFLKIVKTVYTITTLFFKT